MKKIKININGQEIETTPDRTILDIAREFDLDDIPTLCHDNRLAPYSSCFVCVVEIEGVSRLVPSCSTIAAEGMTIRTNTDKVRQARKTALELLMSNHYTDCIAPCTFNCPSNVDVQSYIALTSLGKYKDAVKLIKENNPMPLSIGRVCVRNCEDNCRRNIVDEPVAINCIKRFDADTDSKDKWIPERKSNKNKKVAVVGSGPAGLTCAYYLGLEGYKVKIFEKLAKPGGMLRYGIPSFRLPYEILDSEINWIMQTADVDIQFNCAMGIDFGIEDLLNDGYDAIFMAVGAFRASILGLEGEDRTDGIYKGIDFLKSVTDNPDMKLTGEVIVVGGGNTAIDAARTALRSGAEKVTIVYRRSINEMPAHHEEIEAALAEGIEIKFLTNPKSLIVRDNKISGIECLQMKLEKVKDGGRPRPVPVEGSEFKIDCNVLIGAIGQSVDTSFIQKDSHLKLDKWENIIINQSTFETNIRGVFAGGDSVTGPLTAISAIAQGKKAAKSIMNFLDGVSNGDGKKFLSFKNKLSTVSETEYDKCRKQPRESSMELPVSDRINNFSEIDFGFSEIQSHNESNRCLECGCPEYAECKLSEYCDDYGIDISNYTGEIKKYRTDSRHPFIVFEPNKCINCGKCVRTCSEILKVSALGFVNRGIKTIVRPAMDKALSATNCISCGNCIDVCPTGAITEKFPFKILGTLQKENIETICNFCSIGCHVNFKKVTDEICWISNSTEHIIESPNKGYLCSKGRFGHRYLQQKDKQTDAVIRNKGYDTIVSIDEAIEYTFNNVKEIINRYGNDSVAIMASPKLTNEELYLLQKFTRAGLKNNNISSFSYLSNENNNFVLDEMLGFTGSTITSDSLGKADIIVVLNSNLADEALILELKIKSAQKNGAKLILINPAEIEMVKYSDLWIDCKKGSNAVLISGLMREIAARNLTNNEFIRNKIDNFENFIQKLDDFSSEEVINLTGINKEKYDELLELMLNRNSNIIFIFNSGSAAFKSNADLAAAADFLLITGRIGKEDNGIILLRETNNSAGALDMGSIPEYLPGYVKYHSKNEIAALEQLWQINLTDIFKPNDLQNKLRSDSIKALLVFGEDPLYNEKNRKLLNGVEFLLVSESFKTNIMDYADVILPATAFNEMEGTYTNYEHVIQKLNRVAKSKLPLENWEIITKLAGHFSNKFEYHSLKDIFEEISTVNEFYKDAQPDRPVNRGIIKKFLQNRKYRLADFETEISANDTLSHNLNYQENYYIANIKMQLI